MTLPVTAHLKPATEGLRVTYPGTRVALPPDGDVVPLDAYWRERIRDGSVVLVEPKHEEAQVEEPRARVKPKKD